MVSVYDNMAISKGEECRTQEITECLSFSTVGFILIKKQEYKPQRRKPLPEPGVRPEK